MVVSLRDMVMLLQGLAVWPMSNVLNLPHEMVRLPLGEWPFLKPNVLNCSCFRKGSCCPQRMLGSQNGWAAFVPYGFLHCGS